MFWREGVVHIIAWKPHETWIFLQAVFSDTTKNTTKPNSLIFLAPGVLRGLQPCWTAVVMKHHTAMLSR